MPTIPKRTINPNIFYSRYHCSQLKI